MSRRDYVSSFLINEKENDEENILIYLFNNILISILVF